MNYSAFFANAAVALGVGLVLGASALVYQEPLDALVRELTPREAAASKPAHFQFSLRGLLVLMAICGVIAAGVGHILAGRPQVLGLIYALGPWALVGLAYVPARIGWKQRVAVLIPMTLILIALAVTAGATLQPPLEFDKTLLGIFVCWTPQAALAALVSGLVVIGNHIRQRKHTGRLLAGDSR